MSFKPLIACVLAASAAAAAFAADAKSPEALGEEVRAAEIAFAKTMADRDHAAFTSLLSEEAVFWGPSGPMRGRAAVALEWKPLFEGPKAPFSWAPKNVAVVATGDVGFSSGPVSDPDGNRTGTYNSVWRKEADGKWRIIFDNGCPACPTCPK